jgi:hypothetical protein
MAQYTHLPIYKTTYELLNLVTKKTKTFPRDFKYSLGDKIRNECIDLVVFIYKANSTKDKKQFLEQLLERIQVIQLLIRLSKDLHLINVKSFSEIVTWNSPKSYSKI